MAKRKKRASFAVNVNENVRNKFKGCSLCSKVDGKPSDHQIFRGTKFKNSRMKLEQLEWFNGCTKCTSLDHVTNKCNFRFNRKCDICLKQHFRFLCPQCPLVHKISKLKIKPRILDFCVLSGPLVHKISKLKIKPLPRLEASSGVVVLQNATCNSIMPTFLFDVNGSKFRALKEGRSQSSFVTRKFAESQNLRVLRSDVKLTVEGFNRPQTYLTQLVEVCVKLGPRG